MEQGNRRKSFNTIRGITGIAMGGVYLFVAYLVIYLEKHKKGLNIGETFAYILGALLFVYGVFRIFRGAKQIQNKDASGL